MTTERRAYVTPDPERLFGRPWCVWLGDELIGVTDTCEQGCRKAVRAGGVL